MKKLYIDIGGTHLRSEIDTPSGTICENLSSQTQGLLSYIDKKIKEHPEISFIGVSYAGQISDGVILSAPNICIDEKEISKTVKLRYNKCLVIDNDLNCALIAEAKHCKTGNLAVLYVGTGMGAAVLDNARLLRGSDNLSYEIGHIPYRKAPFVCGCGRDNCVELFASGSGISKWLQYYGSERASDLQGFKDSHIEYEKKISQQFDDALLHAAGTLITIANPDTLVLGGGIIKENPYLIDVLKRGLERYALKASLDKLVIKISSLENAPLLGTKLLEKYI